MGALLGLATLALIGASLLAPQAGTAPPEDVVRFVVAVSFASSGAESWTEIHFVPRDADGSPLVSRSIGGDLPVEATVALPGQRAFVIPAPREELICVAPCGGTWVECPLDLCGPQLWGPEP